MSVWIPVLLAGAVSYLIRLLPVAALSSRPVPAWLARVGPLTAPVAFAALAAATITGSAAEAGVGVLGPRLAALVLAALVAYRTRSTTWTVLSGMSSSGSAQSLPERSGNRRRRRPRGWARRIARRGPEWAMRPVGRISATDAPRSTAHREVRARR